MYKSMLKLSGKRFSSIPDSPFDCIKINALDHHYKFLIRQHNGFFIRPSWALKRSLFQALVEYPKTGSIPKKQFHPISASV